MKSTVAAAVVLGAAPALATQSPIGKVLQMISDLEQKVIGEGEKAQKRYQEVSEFCENRNRELNFEVKTSKGEIDNLASAIDKEAADMESLTARIDDLASHLSKTDAELKKASEIRSEEAAEFATVEKALDESVDTLKRASAVIQREMQGGASFAQLTGIKGLTTALEAVVGASSLGSADATRLTALIQSADESDSEEDDDETEAQSEQSESADKGGGVLETLGNLLDKAQDQLAEARKAEDTALMNFALKKQALTNEIKYATKDMNAAKKNSAACAERKSTAEGEMSATKKDMQEDLASLAELHKDCMSEASDFETETNARTSELKALAAAKKIIQESTGGASAAASFVQVSMTSSVPAVKIVRKLALSQRSAALAKLAQHMQAALRDSAVQGRADPFAKVKGMVEGMITKLEDEAEADANQKAFCDKELAEATAKKEDMSTDVQKLTTKVDQNTAASTKLKEEVKELQRELAENAKAQDEMDKIRAEQKANYVEDKAEIEKGLEGVKAALTVLRDYYAAGDANNAAAGGGIITLLEVVESDFSKALAEMVAAEENAAAEYTVATNENEVAKAGKSKDVDYKNKEAASLDKTNTEIEADISGMQEELDANNEGLATLQKQCVGKADSYAETAARRQKELDGLKEALGTLGGDDGAASFLQSSSRIVRASRHLRGM
eukprot:TRINITY_DN1607_c0_g1_i1.p1 TRINITY_DN1607_c0_g1~~TRINITY_DN1607_c0_g1_i1.p1  ORF type:complete len:676 (+),score=272.60 TRINITY_DN1607_c0_g1_i1:96-2123(+)